MLISGLISGVRISELPPPGVSLKLQHLEPLAILPVDKSNGEIVCSQLVELVSLIRSDAGRELSAELVEFIARQSESAVVGERLPGSSEVLESSIGRLKYLEGDHQKGGFTQLILTWAAIVGECSSTLIGEAIEPVPGLVNYSCCCPLYCCALILYSTVCATAL